MKKIIFPLIILLVLPHLCFAQSDILISNAWVREVPPGTNVSAAYLTLNNKGGQADKLIAISSDAAENVELHISKVDENGVAKMERIKALEIPASKSVELKPGGMHLMLIGLKGPMGNSVTIDLSFEKNGNLSVQVPVKSNKDNGDAHHHH